MSEIVEPKTTSQAFEFFLPTTPPPIYFLLPKGWRYLLSFASNIAVGCNHLKTWAKWLNLWALFTKLCHRQINAIVVSTVSDEWDMTRKTTATHLVLDQFLPYVLNRAGHRTGEMFSQDLIEFGLVLSDWRIMIALWQNENRRLNELADITFSDLSTLSRQVRAMEKSGLIARKRSRTDGRALNLVLTPKGRTITAKLIPIARMYENVATLGISEMEAETVRRCVTKMYKNLEAFGEKRRNESTTKRGARKISAA